MEAFLPALVGVPLAVLMGFMGSWGFSKMHMLGITDLNMMEEPSKRELDKLNKKLQVLKARKVVIEEKKEIKKKKEKIEDNSLDNLIIKLKDTLVKLPKDLCNSYQEKLSSIVLEYDKKILLFSSIKESTPNFYQDLVRQYESELKTNIIKMLEEIQLTLKDSINSERLIDVTKRLNEIVSTKNNEEVITNFALLTYEILVSMGEADLVFNEQLKDLVASYYMAILENHQGIDIKKLLCSIHLMFYHSIKRKLEQEMQKNIKEENLLVGIFYLSEKYTKSINQNAEIYLTMN